MATGDQGSRGGCLGCNKVLEKWKVYLVWLLTWEGKHCPPVLDLSILLSLIHLSVFEPCGWSMKNDFLRSHYAFFFF